jgi:hypothetical protein
VGEETYPEKEVRPVKKSAKKSKREKKEDELLSLHPCYLEALCLFHVFRGLGFSADHLYVAVLPTESVCYLGIVYRKPGERQIALMGVEYPFEEYGLADAWDRACKLLNRAKEKTRMKMWDRSQTKRNATQIVANIFLEQAGGVDVPAADFRLFSSKSTSSSDLPN